MFLKFRYRLGYESLCREVSDSIIWRMFCRIPLDRLVPHPATLMKLTTRCGSVAVGGLNEALLAKAHPAPFPGSDVAQVIRGAWSYSARRPRQGIPRLERLAKRMRCAGLHVRGRLAGDTQLVRDTIRGRSTALSGLLY
jgi:IS5 family transposase